VNKIQHYFFYYSKSSLLLLFALIVWNCNSPKKDKFDLNSLTKKEVKYASTFSLYEGDEFQVIEVKEPWPKAEKSLIYVLAEEESFIPENLEFQQFIQLPIEKIVATSTTHIPSLESLEELDKLIGFPNLDYISSKKARQLIQDNKIKELGQNERLNTEVLISLNTDVVIGFAVEGSNKSLNSVEKAGVPVLYNSDWLENEPLGKAEWIKVFGLLSEKEAEAFAIFKEIEENYLATKQIAKKATNQPKVISGAMHNDRWYLPYGDSWQGQLLEDANANYIYNYTHGSGSIALAFEKVLEKGQDADFWIGPAQYTSLKQLLESNKHYQKFNAFQEKNVFGAALVTGETGGSIYYELGPNRPDLILKDLVKILHPELIENHELVFFKALE